MEIFFLFPTVNISKRNFWLVICIAMNYIWTNLKVIFSILEFFCTLRFQIVVSLPNIVLSIQTIHQWTDELVSFQIMCKSQFLKIGTYVWFCGPGSHLKMCWDVVGHDNRVLHCHPGGSIVVSSCTWMNTKTTPPAQVHFSSCWWRNGDLDLFLMV